jgi:beta-lactamase class A
VYQRKRSLVVRRRRHLAIALTSSLGLMVGMWLPSPQAKAPPEKDLHDRCSPPQIQATLVPTNVKADSIRTLPENAPKDPPKDQCVSMAADSKAAVDFPESQRLLQQYDALSQHLQVVERQQLEQATLKSYWDQAMKLATKASEVGKNAGTDVQSLQDAKSLWQEAIDTFQQIPANSDYRDRVEEKIATSQKKLGEITYRLEVAQSDFLADIAKSSGLSRRAKMTICHLQSHRCRRLRGNEHPRSAASLMKLPVAVAVMHKLTTENIRFDTPIYVDPSNYTEDASDIWVGQEYPIETVLNQMIAKSSNIATNQLIDYLGWDYINQVLAKRGFKDMRISFKVMGDRIMPRNPGYASNLLTSDELTEMMIQIYNREHLGDERLILALQGQYDRALGFAGIETAVGNWLGEKTGQTSKVLGTTLAMNLFGETYIITVIDDGYYSEPTIRRVVSEIADYILQNGHL